MQYEFHQKISKVRLRKHVEYPSPNDAQIKTH